MNMKVSGEIMTWDCKKQKKQNKYLCIRERLQIKVYGDFFF